MRKLKASLFLLLKKNFGELHFSKFNIASLTSDAFHYYPLLSLFFILQAQLGTL